MEREMGRFKKPIEDEQQRIEEQGAKAKRDRQDGAAKAAAEFESAETWIREVVLPVLEEARVDMEERGYFVNITPNLPGAAKTPGAWPHVDFTIRPQAPRGPVSTTKHTIVVVADGGVQTLKEGRAVPGISGTIQTLGQDAVVGYITPLLLAAIQIHERTQ